MSISQALFCIFMVKKGTHEPKARTAEAYPEYCYSPLDGMLVHRRVTSRQYVAGTHLYTCVKREKVEWSFLSKETTRWVRLETRISRSRVQGCNHSALHASTCLWFHVNGKKERGGSTSCHLDQIDLVSKGFFWSQQGKSQESKVGPSCPLR